MTASRLLLGGQPRRREFVAIASPVLRTIRQVVCLEPSGKLGRSEVDKHRLVASCACPHDVSFLDLEPFFVGRLHAVVGWRNRSASRVIVPVVSRDHDDVGPFLLRHLRQFQSSIGSVRTSDVAHPAAQSPSRAPRVAIRPAIPVSRPWSGVSRPCEGQPSRGVFLPRLGRRLRAPAPSFQRCRLCSPAADRASCALRNPSLLASAARRSVKPQSHRGFGECAKSFGSRRR